MPGFITPDYSFLELSLSTSLMHNDIFATQFLPLPLCTFYCQDPAEGADVGSNNLENSLMSESNHTKKEKVYRLSLFDSRKALTWGGSILRLNPILLNTFCWNEDNN